VYHKKNDELEIQGWQEKRQQEQVPSLPPVYAYSLPAFCCCDTGKLRSTGISCQFRSISVKKSIHICFWAPTPPK